MPKWVALFSQSGSEIVELSERLGRRPDKIYTNNQQPGEWIAGMEPDIVDSHDEIMKQLELYDNLAIVTLHGYLRIIPDRTIKQMRHIFNGHPALCNRYPELKGKDPQEKTWNSIKEYPIIGSIVHEVVPEVDGGKVLKEVCYTNHLLDKNDLYRTLRRSSLIAWEHFFRDRL